MILEIIILLLAIPAGYLIARLSYDELAAGRKWFGVLIIASILAGIWFYLIGMKHIAFTSGFILIVSLISLIKSKI